MEKNWLHDYDNRMMSKSVLVGKNGLAMHAKRHGIERQKGLLDIQACAMLRSGSKKSA